MGSICSIDHTRKTCVTAYLNLRTELQKYAENCTIFDKKKVMVYINIIELDHCCCAKKIVILWYISGLENQTFKLWYYHWASQGKPNKRLFQAVMHENARYWMASSSLMSPGTGHETFLKAHIAVSEVVDRQRFNTAVFCTPVAYTKHELRAAIGETGDRPMFCKEQCRDLKEDLFPKTVPYFRPNKS